ncbi:hypothetical protein BGZ83_007163 [Gryganskiella cystojenkinii]|nr:hypothetical protein BGZ83_007163 [Gryganskiella cystojenkinii]
MWARPHSITGDNSGDMQAAGEEHAHEERTSNACTQRVSEQEQSGLLEDEILQEQQGFVQREPQQQMGEMEGALFTTRDQYHNNYEQDEENEEEADIVDANTAAKATKTSSAVEYMNRHFPRNLLLRSSPRLPEEEQRLLPADPPLYTHATTTTTTSNTTASSSSPISTTHTFPSPSPPSSSAHMPTPGGRGGYAKGEPMVYPHLHQQQPSETSSSHSRNPSKADSDDALIKKKNALADAGSATAALSAGTSSSSASTSYPPYPPPVVITLDPNAVDTPQDVFNPMTDDERRCRICLEGDNEPTLGHLISPCHCKGSSRYIHLKCLERWRELSPRKESFYRCDTCHYHYSFSRPWIAKILEHGWFVHTMSVLMLIGLIYSTGWIGHVLQDKGAWRWKDKFFHGPGDGRKIVLGLDGPDYLFGLVWIAGFGLIILCIGCFCGGSGEDGTQRNDGSDSCCGGDCCSGNTGSCYIVDCGGSSGGEEVVIMLVVAVLFVGTIGAFVGLYRILASINKRVLNNMKETILEVK